MLSYRVDYWFNFFTVWLGLKWGTLHCDRRRSSPFKLRPDCSCINPSKARRLVERYNELPDRYMQVIGRCRDPGSLDDLEELRRSRPIRQENKEQVKLERSLMRKEKAAEKEEKM